MTALSLMQINDADLDRKFFEYGFRGNGHMGQSAWIVPVLIDIINYCETNNRSDVAETLAEALRKIAPTVADCCAGDDLFQEDRSDILHLESNVLAFPQRSRFMSDQAETGHAPANRFQTILSADFVAF